MTLEQITPEWGQEYIAGTLAGDPEVASSLIAAMAGPDRADAVLVMYEMKLPKPAFRTALHDVWIHDHGELCGASDLLTLGCMFDYAEFDTSALPQVVTVYRGTSGLSQESAEQGLSWTTSRETAAWFAMRHADRYGKPLVLRTEVHRDCVLMHTDAREESEVLLDFLVVPDLFPDVDGDPEEWQELCAAEEARRREANAAA